MRRILSRSGNMRLSYDDSHTKHFGAALSSEAVASQSHAVLLTALFSFGSCRMVTSFLAQSTLCPAQSPHLLGTSCMV